jgi:hypothetical protein
MKPSRKRHKKYLETSYFYRKMMAYKFNPVSNGSIDSYRALLLDKQAPEIAHRY